MSKIHEHWARLVAPILSKTMDKSMSTVNDGQVWSPIKPALLLTPRDCPYCHEHVLYRLCHWRVEDMPWDYHFWGCAECGKIYLICTSDETHQENEPCAFDFAPRLVNARGQR